MRSFLTKYYSCDQMKSNETDGGVGRMRERKIVYRDYARKPEVMIKLVRPRRRWEMILK